MTFNIRQKIFDRDGMLLEKVAEQYKEQLSKSFFESPEGQALLDEGIEPGWSDMVVDLGMNYYASHQQRCRPTTCKKYCLISSRAKCPLKRTKRPLSFASCSTSGNSCSVSSTWRMPLPA